jgi:hypothetical protein
MISAEPLSKNEKLISKGRGSQYEKCNGCGQKIKLSNKKDFWNQRFFLERDENLFQAELTETKLA